MAVLNRVVGGLLFGLCSAVASLFVNDVPWKSSELTHQCFKSEFLGAATGSPYIVFISTSGM